MSAYSGDAGHDNFTISVLFGPRFLDYLGASFYRFLQIIDKGWLG